MELTKLTKKHGIKMSASSSVSVGDCSLAVGQAVGHISVKSMARMDGAVVIIVDTVEKANGKRHHSE